MVSSNVLLFVSLLSAPLLLYLCAQRLFSRQGHPFPPGPKPLPFIGNLLEIPMSNEYQTYFEWGKEYGDVVHVRALGQHIVILNSIEAADELLGKRSENYSDRPYIPMLLDPGLMDADWSFSFKQYSPSWKRHRRLFVQHLNPNAARSFFNKQTKSTHTFLRSLLHSPEDFAAHIRQLSAAIVMDIAYGYEVQPKNDPFIKLAERVSRTVLEGVRPGGYLVNVFPWLRHLPTWFPGAGFKAAAAEAKKLGQNLVQLPFKDLQARIAEGTATPCFAVNALAELPSDATMSEELLSDIRDVAANMFGAGADTTVSSLHSCILGLLLTPSVRARAQAELDSVLGPVSSPAFRLPTFSDRPNLPYIDAIIKEGFRWLPALPTGVPHATLKEDIYRGWRIPKRTIVIANERAILHDPALYSDPFAFRPERFLPGDGKEPDRDPGLTGAFGFGRRICPGQQLAEASLWIQIASILSAFTLSLANDKEGRDINVDYAATFLPGVIAHPKPFPCSFTPRSKETEARVLETELETQ